MSLDASLEGLRSFYFDRGYLKSKIVSSQVLLSPDKRYVYIHIKVFEGPQYRFSGYEIIGHPILEKKQLTALILIKKGQIFSRKNHLVHK